MTKDYFNQKTSTVEKDADIGEDTKIWHYAHVRSGSKIGKNCNLGKDVYVDEGVVIGDNVRIQNGVSLYKGVLVKDDVFLGPHMTFTNDLYPRANNNGWVAVETLVKKGASIGAHATVISGVTIGEYSMVGAGAVVTKDVPDFGLVYGNPAVLKGFVCYCGSRLSEVYEENDDFMVLSCSKCDKHVKVDSKIFRKVKKLEGENREDTR
ncbi:MAG: acyltransferase [Thermoplasmata archaeon]